MRFKQRNDRKIVLHSNLNIDFPAKENLVYKAAYLLQQKTQCQKGADIWLEKHIPQGAGLGGGSSDAATTLLGLNHLWQTNCPITKLQKWSLVLGADIPFFVFGQNAWAEGIGEKLEAINLPHQWFVLLVPTCQINTQQVFTNPKLPRNSAKITKQGYEAGNISTRNDCESIVCEQNAAVFDALSWLSQFGKARLTGTGACVFLSCARKSQAETIKKTALAENRHIILAESVNFSLVHQVLAL